MFIPCKMFTVKIFYPLDIVNCSCLLSIGTLLWTCTTEKDDFGDSPMDLFRFSMVFPSLFEHTRMWVFLKTRVSQNGNLVH